MTERWLSVPGWPQYEVSDQGRVKSLGNQFNRKEKILRPGLMTGYRHVILCDKKPKRRWKVRIAELVLVVFVGPRPTGLVMRHLNDVRLDDRLSNLTWGTQSENLHDAYNNGRRPNYWGKPRKNALEQTL